MDQVSLRQLYPLEAQLHHEMTTVLEELIANDGLTGDRCPSTKLVGQAIKIAEFFDTIGFVLTSSGVMARIDRDIFPLNRADVRDAIEVGWTEVEMAMHRGPIV